MSATSGSSSSIRIGGVTQRKVDDRIKFVIENAVQKKHRSVVLVVGDRAKDQIVNLHLMVSRANHNAKVNVLWCMKKEVDFGSTSKKRQEKRARLEVKGGLATESTKEAFQTFLSQTQIRFCQYKETHKILGQTFGMAVLQDFEAMTPNTLARTIETVKGGGMIVIMFRALRSLKQLYTIAMDVHARYRTEAHRDVVPRFNERFLLSLATCESALCVDDELNVLPFTSKMKDMGKAHQGEDYDSDLAVQGRLRHEVDLENLKNKLQSSSDVGPLVKLCMTLDQAKTVLSLMQTVAEKTLSTTCAVTAGRGRGKSAALGLAAAGAIAMGYSNIFCTAPSPENLQAFFEFVVRGLVEMGYKERVEFEAIQSTNPEFSKCIIRINVFREHRQTVQFISANDTHRFAQAELAIIDEAAALPLTLVKKMLGPYLIFLSSTVSGYEGTGRSLSMKLVADMRKHSGATAAANGADNAGVADENRRGTSEGRLLRELSMKEPIRYGPEDPVEDWLNKLLCLDATSHEVKAKSCPHPSTCELYYVNRDALFSYHPLAEQLLQSVVSLLVAAHYKNQPNDIQLMSDAPGHHVFVLCGKNVQPGELPDVFCVIHACEEGNVSAGALSNSISKGLRPSGDLIPYTLSQYFLEDGFARLTGLRVLRIATNPEFQRAGYGSRALELLHEYYTGSINLNPATKSGATGNGSSADAEKDDDVDYSSTGATLNPRKKIPSLMTRIDERPYEVVDYLGVSYGVTTELFNFWRRSGFEPLYVRQAANDLTGEHSCIMVSPLGIDLAALKVEFRRRFISLLPLSFRSMPSELALSMITDIDVYDPKKLSAFVRAPDGSGDLAALQSAFSSPSAAAVVVARAQLLQQPVQLVHTVDNVPQCTWRDICEAFSAGDLKRLKLSTTSFVETGVVLDLVTPVARLYFDKKLHRFPHDGTDGVVLTHAQAALLLAVGLQCITVDEVATQPAFQGVQTQQLRAFFNKAMSRVVEHIMKLQKVSVPLVSTSGEKISAASTSGSKRAREKVNSVDGEEEGNEDEGSEGDEEEEREVRDREGNVIGLTVRRVVKSTVNTDTTLLRDAKHTTFGSDVTGSGSKQFKNLDYTFKRPKKGKAKGKK